MFSYLFLPHMHKTTAPNTFFFSLKYFIVFPTCKYFVWCQIYSSSGNVRAAWYAQCPACRRWSCLILLVPMFSMMDTVLLAGLRRAWVCFIPTKKMLQQFVVNTAQIIQHNYIFRSQYGTTLVQRLHWVILLKLNDLIGLNGSNGLHGLMVWSA